ncbi:MAG: helix-turn-helix domain-containing protein [Actinomycetota bacterium]
MDQRNEIREFLASRRARITPERAGLPAYGANRRVPGLRREEVALLAGVSVDYYTQMERGNLAGVSDSVLDALASALQLDEAEWAHLFDLARTATTPARSPRPGGPQRVRPSIQRLLDAMIGVPAYVRTGRLGILAANRLGHALYAPVLAGQRLPVNLGRFLFLDPRAGDFYVDWDKTANDAVAILRGEAGRNPNDRQLQDIVGELSTRSEDFRARWGAHNVRLHRTGGKQLHHPVAGDLELTYEALELPADPGLTMITYTAEPGSASQDALDFLASWAATVDQAETAEAPDQA